MAGKIFNGMSFSELIEPILEDLDRFYWMVELKAPPQDPGWAPADEDSTFLYPSDTDRMYPWVVWKSGQLARIAPHVTYLDEFTHFVGFDANESNLKARISFLQSMEFGSASWIDRLDDYAEVVVIWGDGWWEVYSTRESILKRLTNKFPSRPGDIHRAI